MDNTIINLQIKLEYQAEEIASLSKELFTQQKELAALSRRLSELTQRCEALENDQGSANDAGDEPPPPHY